MTYKQSAFRNPASIVEAKERSDQRRKAADERSQSCDGCIHKSMFLELDYCSNSYRLTRAFILKRCGSFREV